ncbi:hypothetical protein ACIQU6_44850, partial [Streptomyces sp. NPDC090442]
MNPNHTPHHGERGAEKTPAEVHGGTAPPTQAPTSRQPEKGIRMVSPPSTIPLDVSLQLGKPPTLLADPGHDPAHWAGQHRDALYATLREHGVLLVRGLGLGDVAVT